MRMQDALGGASADRSPGTKANVLFPRAGRGPDVAGGDALPAPDTGRDDDVVCGHPEVGSG